VPAGDQMQEAEKVGQQDDEKSTSVSCFPGQNAAMRVLEVGCGVGNTVIPVLQTNKYVLENLIFINCVL
jgi:tRNA G46 methylase TrmB